MLKVLRAKLTVDVNVKTFVHEHGQFRVIKIKTFSLTEIKEIFGTIASHKVYYMRFSPARDMQVSVCLPSRYSSTIT